MYLETPLAAWQLLSHLLQHQCGVLSSEVLEDDIVSLQPPVLALHRATLHPPEATAAAAGRQVLASWAAQVYTHLGREGKIGKGKEGKGREQRCKEGQGRAWQSKNGQNRAEQGRACNVGLDLLDCLGGDALIAPGEKEDAG